MKNFSLLLFTVVFFSASSGQNINSWSYFPQNPTENDSIEIYVHTSFTSGSCPLDSTSIIDSANTIIVEFFHCLGMLSVICDAYDTIVIPPQSAGAHYVTIREYYTGFPCTQGYSQKYEAFGGIMVGPSSIHSANPCDIKASYRSEISSLNIQQTSSCNTGTAQLTIYDLHGRLLFTEEILSYPANIPIVADAGVYFYVLRSAQSSVSGKFVNTH